MKNRISTLLATSALCALAPFSALADGAASRLVISHSGNISGMPAPYLHKANGAGFILQSYVFDTLVGQDLDGSLVPALADSWTLSEDGLHYTVHLNADAKWHDGADVNAEDVVFTITYMTQNPYRFLPMGNVAGAEALSDDQLRISLKSPDTGALRTILGTMPILPEHVYGAHPDAVAFTTEAATIGAGPYRFVSYDRAQGRYLMEAAEDYYLGAPKFDQLAMVKLAPGAAIEAAAAGQVDVVSGLPLALVGKARENGLVVESAISNHPDRLAFNHDGLFGDLNLRRALAHLVDRQALVEIGYQGAAVPAELGYFQKSSPWFDGADVQTYALDPARAAEFFTAAGWEKSGGLWQKDGAPVTLRLITTNKLKKLATVLREQLEGFGLGVDLRTLESGAIAKTVAERDFDIMLTTSSTMGAPTGVARRIFGKSWRSDQYVGDGALKALLASYGATQDPEEKTQILRDFQAQYARELPSIMLTNPYKYMAHNGRAAPAFLPDGVAMGVPSAMHEGLFFR